MTYLEQESETLDVRIPASFTYDHIHQLHQEKLFVLISFGLKNPK